MTTLSYAAADSATMLRRNLRHMLRYPSMTLMLVGLPVIFLLLFVYVFGGAISSGSKSYVSYLLPGILLITVATGIAYVGFRLFLDMQS
ncbi:MAG TPA: ABC transporter permease, partial [Actinobacteria bacterium]|nr:ABC transporter permease [Actinomycetota bacterium]